MNNGFDEKALIARAEDVVALCEKQYSPKALGFLTPAEAVTIRSHIKKNILGSDISFKFFGGYDEAERCMFLVFPEYAEETVERDFITLLEISGRDIGGLSHRDFLGSLLGLGIKREKIGDILCLEDRCLVFVAQDIAQYIASNLLKVANCGVLVRTMDIESTQVPKRKVEEISATVSALRLDAVVAAALRTSRSQAAEIVRSKRVFVNWQESDDVSMKVKPGDVFSVRGAGRFRLGEDIRETRKGRIGICIEKAI